MCSSGCYSSSARQQAFWPCSQPTSALSNFKAMLISSKPTVQCPVTQAPAWLKKFYQIFSFTAWFLFQHLLPQRCQPESAPTSLGKIRCSGVGTLPLWPFFVAQPWGPAIPSHQPAYSFLFPSQEVCYEHLVAPLAIEEFPQPGRRTWGAGRREKIQTLRPTFQGHPRTLKDRQCKGYSCTLSYSGPWSIPQIKTLQNFGVRRL